VVGEQDGLRLLIAQIDADGRLAHCEVGVATPAGWRLASAAAVVHDEMGLRLPTLAFATSEPGQFAVAVLDAPKRRLVLIRHSCVDLAPPPWCAAAPLPARDVSLHTQCDLVDGPTLCLVASDGTTASFSHLRFGPPQPWDRPLPQPARMPGWSVTDRVLCGLPRGCGAPPSIVVARRPPGRPASIELLLLPAGGAPALPFAVLVVGGAAESATCAHASMASGIAAGGELRQGQEMSSCDGGGPRGGVAGVADAGCVRLWVGCSSGGVHRYTISHSVLQAAAAWAEAGGEGDGGAAGGAAVTGAAVHAGAAANGAAVNCAAANGAAVNGAAVNGAAVNGAAVNGPAVNGDFEEGAFPASRVWAPMPVGVSLLLGGPVRRVEPVAWSWGADEAVAVECDCAGAGGGSAGRKDGLGGGGRGVGGGAAGRVSCVHVLSGAGEPLHSVWGVSGWGVTDLARTATPQLLLWGLGGAPPGRQGDAGGAGLPAGCALLVMGHAWAEAGEHAPRLAPPTIGPGHTASTPPAGDAAAAQPSPGPQGGPPAATPLAFVSDASSRGTRLYAIARALGDRATAGQAQVRLGQRGRRGKLPISMTPNQPRRSSPSTSPRMSDPAAPYATLASSLPPLLPSLPLSCHCFHTAPVLGAKASSTPALAPPVVPRRPLCPTLLVAPSHARLSKALFTPPCSPPTFPPALLQPTLLSSPVPSVGRCHRIPPCTGTATPLCAATTRHRR
jgi:hypothetical protein